MSSKSSKKPQKKKRVYTPAQREAQRVRAKTRYAALTPEQRGVIRERQREYQRKYQRERYRKDTHRDLKRLYGITAEDFDLMLVAQGYRCAICGSKEFGRKTATRFCVDHNHKTGKVRGLLCHPCNTGLGRFKDNPLTLSKAITYLEDRDG